jgi:hypothetical protein
MAVQDRPEVVRVIARPRVEPALVVLVAIVALVSAAIWKPWTETAKDPVRPARAEIDGGSPRVVMPTLTVEAVVLGSAGERSIAALDLSIIGSVDSHEGWGVSAAYVPITDIAVATRKRLPSVKPTVEWTAVEPGRRVEVPVSGPAIATVAIAVTWPSSLPPRDVRLFHLRPRGSGSDPASREVELLRPLPRIVTLTRRGGREHFHPSERVAWPFLSGVFYLPPSGPLPARPRDWLSAGWPAGEYEFRVTRADGEVVKVRFFMRGGGAPVR